MDIFNKIKDFLKKIIKRQKKLSEGQSEIGSQKNNQDFFETIKRETKSYINKNEILEQINNNPDLIYSLSYTRLVQLNELYEKRIKEVEAQIYNE